MNCWGERFRVTIFGESHGAGIGVVIDGIPAGTTLDLDAIRREMRRRAPGQDSMSTPRREKDEVKILSGFFEGRTTGTPLAGVIENTNTISKDYTPELLRPGHADFTGWVKYGASHDYRGGGHFSGRLTAPLVFAGAIAKQILKQEGILIGAHILTMGEIHDKAFDSVTGSPELFETIQKQPFPTIDQKAGNDMQAYILEKKNELDSVGGVIECSVTGLPVGLGNPFFGSVESKLSSMMFSVPAVKGIEFGDGFRLAELTGSVANDEFCIENGAVKTRTNHNGGINGGISNGMPLLFKVAIKPTPSIAKVQKTVNLKAMEETEFSVRGRHDPCIAHRAVPVIEAGCAIALLDMLKTK